MTNAEKIRSMSDEELAVSIMCPAEYDLSFNKECKCNGEMNRNCCKCTLKWLQSEAEQEENMEECEAIEIMKGGGIDG